MRLRSVRLTLFAVFAAAVAAATYHGILLDGQMEEERAVLRAFESEVRATSVTLADLRAAQQAYVAVGQVEAFWFGRVTTLLEELRAGLARLHAHARGPAGEALDAAGEIVETFTRMDARVRELVRSDQRLLASDLIFTDGIELLASAGARIGEAHTAQAAELRRTLSEARQSALWIVVAALAVSLLVVILLLPRATPQTSLTDAAERAGTGEAHGPGAEGLSLRTPRDEAHGLPAPAGTQGETGAGTVDLAAAASLCTDLGRIASPSELPAMLERAGRLLGASGLVIWLGDGPERALRPVMAHGYSARALSRMGTIPRESENATAGAYRDGRLQTVRGNAFLEGAIVAPLVTSTGCVGVMAAEVKDGRENSASVQALAGILAAQLALVVGGESSGQEATPSRQQVTT